MIFRLSQKLAKKIKVGKLAEVPLAENQYTDWSAHVFYVARMQYIIVSNTESMYSCVMYASGITDDNRFIQRSLELIREFMEDDGKAEIYERNIIPSTGLVTFAKSLNRSVTGSMNELVQTATQVLEDDIAPHSAGNFLNDLLLSAIAAEGAGGYGKPNEAFQRLQAK